jgi:mono/diheme cytochrome c family protein
VNYPIWYLPDTGGGLLIAIIAITHVFVSHFAVGGGLYLIFAELKGYREDNQAILDFTKGHARFFLLLTMVFGSISGVGIWFIVSLVSPSGVSLLIHNYVFGWAAEWVFFLTEIVAAFVYFYTFGRMDRDTHIKVGWVYFISAWLSLFLINGIIGFMLTPGDWLTDHNFWSGFFNPTFFPSLFFRSFIAFLMAGVFALLTTSFLKDAVLHRTMTLFSGKWALTSLFGSLLSGYWYLAVLPTPAHDLVMGKSPTITTFVKTGLYSMAILMVCLLLLTLVKPALNKKPVALLIFCAAFVYFGSFEWIREAARRPYVVNEVLYTNNIYKKDVARLTENGFLKEAKWKEQPLLTEDNQVEVGRDLYILQCYSCHTLEGINNPLAPKTKSMSYQAMIHYLLNTIKQRPFMPPFVGTEEEAKALAAYLTNGLHGTELSLPKKAASPLARGTELFTVHCASCHEVPEMTDMVDHWDVKTAKANLCILSELNEDMPDFSGTESEKADLALYLFSLNNEVQEHAAPLDGAEVFSLNCSGCHDVETLAEAAQGMGDDFRTALDALPEINEDMPPCAATPAEKDALATYLQSFKGGAQ